MSYTFANRKRADGPAVQKDEAAQPAMDALRSGTARPTQEQMGHRVDLPDVMRSKMENTFGADLSAVKLYESQTVADAGAKAITQGASIAFAPGLLDFTSYGGQALLGHELSHVVTQARGEVTGGGFLNDYSLEARADREGAMAASGRTVAMPAASLSPVTAAAAAGPMQAKDKDKSKKGKKDAPAAQAAPATQAAPAAPAAPDEIDQLAKTTEEFDADLPPASLPPEALAATAMDGSKPIIPTVDPKVLPPVEAAAAPKSAPSAPAPPASLPPEALAATAMDGSKPIIPTVDPKVLPPVEAAAAPKSAPSAPAPPASLPPEALAATAMDGSRPIIPTVDPKVLPSAENTPAPPAAAAGQSKYRYGSGDRSKYSLSSGGASFVLGRNNAKSRKHGKEFSNMMSALDTLSEVKSKGSEGGIANEAMLANANRGAIQGMKEYRRKLKSEKGNDADRIRQIAALKAMIHSAKGDQAAAEERGSETLSGQDFGGVIRGGMLNQVYRYERGGEGAYFKPAKVPVKREAWKEKLSDTGIPQEKTNEETAQKLAKHQVAFARLGSLLGSNVALGAKFASAGEDTPTGEKYGERIFDTKAGQGGVLMEEAKGKSWMDYNWRFLGVTPNAAGGSAGSPDSQSSEDTVRDALIAYDRKTKSDKGNQGTNLGSRMKDRGLGFTPASTEDPSFNFQREKPENKRNFTDEGPALDMADPDFQQQMNHLFLMDTLAGHSDRHHNNFLVNRGEDGKVGVKAIDDDLTFGTRGEEKDKAAFGKYRGYTNYTGLPSQMQIDSGMAEKISGMDRKTLDLTFSDVLNPEEIESLWTRFGMMKDYIESMSKADPSLIVDQWNDQTAQREVEMAGGIDAHLMSDASQAGNYIGNNYYQQQALSLNSMTTPERDTKLYNDRIRMLIIDPRFDDD